MLCWPLHDSYSCQSTHRPTPCWHLAGGKKQAGTKTNGQIQSEPSPSP